MKWISQDIDTYLGAKEYVDTAVIPLYPVALGEDMQLSAEAAEFITLLTGYLEKQFTGRVLLFPPITYLKNGQDQPPLTSLENWEKSIQSADFKHIFYITSDINWREFEKDLAGTLLWLPSVPMQHMNDSQKMKTIESHVKQLLSVFTRKWHEID
ncbi:MULTISPECIES: YpiF family protein [Bacillaceae]|uniref:YpiF family protein n=1 Tax=Bacillaceae TaxID=186817 RepID=UPI002FFFDF0C